MKKYFGLFVLVLIAMSGAPAFADPPPPPPPAEEEDEKVPNCRPGEYVSYVDNKPVCKRMPAECTTNIYDKPYCRPCKPGQAISFVDGEYKCLTVPECPEGQYLYSDGTKFECKAP